MSAKIGMNVSTKTEFIDCSCEGSHSTPSKFKSMSCAWKMKRDEVWSKSAQNIATKR